MNRYRAYAFALAAYLAAAVSVYASLEELLKFVPEQNEEGSASLIEDDSSEGVAIDMPEVGSVKITQKALLEGIRNDLVMHYGIKGDLEINPLQVWKALTVPAETWKLEVTGYPSGGLASRFPLRFKIHADGRLAGEWNWPFRAELWEEAFVARRQINAGETLNITDFTMRRFDTLRLRDGLVPATSTVGNYSARRTIAANKPLYFNDVESRAIVRKSEMVTVLAENGALSITMTAKALEDGAMGEIVLVRNLQSNKRIQGEVIDENTVRVYF